LSTGLKSTRSLCSQQNIAGVVQWQNGSFPSCYRRFLVDCRGRLAGDLQ
jgi:hypothetical protein